MQTEISKIEDSDNPDIAPNVVHIRATCRECGKVTEIQSDTVIGVSLKCVECGCTRFKRKVIRHKPEPVEPEPEPQAKLTAPHPKCPRCGKDTSKRGFESFAQPPHKRRRYSCSKSGGCGHTFVEGSKKRTNEEEENVIS